MAEVAAGRFIENTIEESTVKYSTLLLTLYIAFLPVSTALSGFIISSSIQSLLAVLFIFVSFVEMLISGKIKIEMKLIPVYVYFLYMISTGLWNSAFSLDWYSMQVMVTFFIIICVSIRCYSKMEIKLVKLAFYGSICVTWISTLFFSFFHGGRIYIEIFSLMDPNDFATGLAMAFALCLTELMGKKNVIFNTACLLSLLVIVYFTGSRGGLLTMLVIIFIWILSLKGKKKYILLGSIFAATIVLFVCAEFGIGPSMIKRFSITALIASGGTGRSDIWKAALKYFATQDPWHMIFGNGLGSFADTVKYVAVGHDYRYESHNMFINVLIEGGIAGLGLLLACFASLYVYAVKNKNLFGILAVTGFIVSGISLDAQVYRTFAIAAAMAVIYRGTGDAGHIAGNKLELEGAAGK
ncbi:MAG: O-antigen ligase family protein [Saccharofermentans sp.]|nr:O-antigen ligase family protein [Saccharofermentans sp.]